MNAPTCILAATGRARCTDENESQETDYARTITTVNIAPVPSSAERVPPTYLTTRTETGKTVPEPHFPISGLEAFSSLSPLLSVKGGESVLLSRMLASVSGEHALALRCPLQSASANTRICSS